MLLLVVRGLPRSTSAAESAGPNIAFKKLKRIATVGGKRIFRD